MNCIETGIPGLLIIEPRVHGDQRGFFMETWHAKRYGESGLPKRFVQANLSRSAAGVVRGLHYQYPEPQGKLVQVIDGRIFDVAVDIRPDSPTFKQWAGVELTADNHRQLYVPEGFAHGFCVLGEGATISYLCTRPFSAEYDAAIAWDDPDIGIEWPFASQAEPQLESQPESQPESLSLSARDRNAPRLRDVPAERLPRMEQGARPGS